MELTKNKDGNYNLLNLTERQLYNIVTDMSVAEFESVETSTFHEIRDKVKKVVGIDPDNSGVYR